MLFKTLDNFFEKSPPLLIGRLLRIFGWHVTTLHIVYNRSPNFMVFATHWQSELVEANVTFRFISRVAGHAMGLQERDMRRVIGDCR